MTRGRDGRLDRIETYYDCVPRAVAAVEQVGPFTLFLAEERTGWQFYARPRLGGGGTFTEAEVCRVLDRQEQLDVPRAIEWVDEVTPTLLPAVRGAGHEPHHHPLLVMPADVVVEADPRARPLRPAEPHLSLALGSVSAGFAGKDDVEPKDPGRRSELMDRGALVVVASFDGNRLCGAGSAAPRGAVAELIGIAVPPGHRGRGHGTAITRSLVAACRAQGVDLVFLSAGSDAAADIYRRIGFVDVGTACVLDLDD
ncbi:GNAT family N-acetyltransferase [Terrabacter sp. MAHUQ-38]|jgi:ribosomal protein S18 acetylase RimI-like enzyme|uniref:GNAT family N-acetyltransferase n=1 Tax=unclassified Terrabacter TaxID=2630222 RepID=UPI00165E63D4|nr:GNAT family N-acetyltransferase [Terrabacter sp. MAHUQ-38]MBC9820413.1 GNAT family N-acetyltransferase [Terrabacter sp. MAHUQ-38]